tara:strand:+ start:1893 stop:3518 length:1626 start_codon:yes stop_codon:yes gene_type:complete
MQKSGQINTFKLLEDQDTLGLIVMLFCSRKNDDDQRVTQYLGSALMDLSQCEKKTYRLSIRDSSSRPPIQTGRVSITMKQIPSNLKHLKCQQSNIIPQMFNAAEANLKWIAPFHSKGCPPIKAGLKMVHSPYYVNHMGITMPSGAFCMIPTDETDKVKAITSHKERLQVSLRRHNMRPDTFRTTIADMLTGTIKSKHLRCLHIIADTLTLHARTNIHYTPDIQMTPTPKGTERWEVPREPSLGKHMSFTGDCEDFAREVYQQAKEIREWVTPSLSEGELEAMSVVLQMYVPTIEQGAVDSSAHTKYITYWAAFRNHIWAALHPRHAFIKKCSQKIKVDYDKWPKQLCESKLPLLHLEGTGDVFPIVTQRNPGYISRLNNKQQQVLFQYPELGMLNTQDLSLQIAHRSNFYKYAIACMTDIFSNEGILDFTYITQGKYGVSIYDWARGNYKFRPSTKHSTESMKNIRELIRLERPISAITDKASVIKTNTEYNTDCLRFGSKSPIKDVPKGTTQAVYQVGEIKWYEIYFKVGNVQSSESESS